MKKKKEQFCYVNPLILILIPLIYCFVFVGFLFVWTIVLIKWAGIMVKSSCVREPGRTLLRKRCNKLIGDNLIVIE